MFGRRSEEEDEWSEDEENWHKDDIDEYDLTQLPRVDKTLAEKLKRNQYDSLWDIAYAEVDDLASIEGITKSSAKMMIDIAKKLLDLEGAV